MNPSDAQQQFEAWQNYYATQGSQQQQAPPANTGDSGYNAYFETPDPTGGSAAGQQDYTGQWQAPDSYNQQPSYNNVPPPNRGGRGGSFRGDRGGRGFGNRGGNRDFGGNRGGRDDHRGGRSGFDRNSGGGSRGGGGFDRNSGGGSRGGGGFDRNSGGGSRFNDRGSGRDYNDRSSGRDYNDRNSGRDYNDRNSGRDNYNQAVETYSGGQERGGPVENKMIFVSGLPQHANETFIHDVFSNEGAIEVNESNGKPKIKIYQAHGISKGECTILFADGTTALQVVAKMNGQTFPGTENIMQISMAEFKSDGRSGGGNRGRDNFRNDAPRDNYRNDRDNGGGDREQRRDFGGDRRGGGGFRENRDFGGDRRGDRGDSGGFSRGGGRGGGFRGGRDNENKFGGDRRGNRGDSGGFSRGGGRGGSHAREGDWPCEQCGNSNFAFRRECNSCKAPRSAGAGQESGGGQMRGAPRRDDNRHRPY